ncbi:MAG: SRPBCC family protein [Bacteroidales bacterium]
MAFYQLHKEQFIPASIDTVWGFISSPGNLKEITPKYMGFEVTSKNLPERVYPGMIISYKVKPLLGIPMAWLTEITHVVDKECFVDEQKIGPYAFWHHQHFTKQVEGGVLMTDIVSYKPPLGFLGSIANWLFIKKQLNGIFNYREKILNKIFPVKKNSDT